MCSANCNAHVFVSNIIWNEILITFTSPRPGKFLTASMTILMSFSAFETAQSHTSQQSPSHRRSETISSKQATTSYLRQFFMTGQ